MVHNCGSGVDYMDPQHGPRIKNPDKHEYEPQAKQGPLLQIFLEDGRRSRNSGASWPRSLQIGRPFCGVLVITDPLYGSFPKSGALIQTPNNRALITRTPTKGTTD